jgi:hypothetical protein
MNAHPNPQTCPTYILVDNGQFLGGTFQSSMFENDKTEHNVIIIAMQWA